MSEILKPCPFCKVNDWQYHAHFSGTTIRQCGVCGTIVDESVINTRPIEDDLRKRIAELEAMVDELKPYRDGYDPEEVFPPEGEWVWLRDCDDNIEPVQYSHKTEWYWNYEGSWMPDDGDIVRWYPIGKLPEVQE